jgi:hypothetical protein
MSSSESQEEPEDTDAGPTRRFQEKAKKSKVVSAKVSRPMTGLPQRHVPLYSLLLGLGLGAVISILILASSPPQGHQWPPAAQVEFATAGFGPWKVAASGTASLPADCTTMLVDMDSTFPASVWVVPHNATIDYNTTVGSPEYYYWSGATPTEHVSAVVSISNPAAGVWLAVFDPSSNRTGQASWGFAFSANDCP